MIENYDEKNIDDTLDAISGFDASELQRFLVFEREHKNRSTLIDAVRSQLLTVEVPGTGYYDGHWFDDAGEHVIRDTPRNRRAINQTDLVLVEDS